MNNDFAVPFEYHSRMAHWNNERTELEDAAGDGIRKYPRKLFSGARPLADESRDKV